MASGRVALVVCLLVLPALLPAPAAAEPPSLTVTVDGTPVADGGRVVVSGEAAARIRASAAVPIERVSVRLDGTLVRAFYPDRRSFDRRLDLDLAAGDNALTVVAVADESRTVEGVVTSDRAGPRVSYVSPFQTDRVEPPPESVRVTSPTVVLEGALHDPSGVESVTVDHRYDYGSDPERRCFAAGGGPTSFQEPYHRATHSLTDPGDAFEQPLTLGLGPNCVTVRLRDGTGHLRIHRVVLRLRDARPPAIEFDAVERVDGGTRLRVAGTVTDDVQLRSVGVTTAGGAGGDPGRAKRFLAGPFDDEPDPDHRSVSFETTIPLDERADDVRFVATDVSGATVTRELPDGPTDPTAPEIRIDDASRADGRVRVRGAVVGGGIDTVVVRTATADGDRLGVATVQFRGTPDRVPVDRRLRAASGGPTVVSVRVTDTRGEAHVENVTVDAPPAATATAAAAATPTAAAAATPDGPVPVAPATAGAVGAVGAAVAAALVLFRP